MPERSAADTANLMVRNFRIMAAIFLGWAAMIIYINEKVLDPPAKADADSLFTVFSVMAVAMAAAAVVVRLKAVPAARRRIFEGDMAARRRWSFSYLGGLALSEAVLLYGFVLRQLGAATRQALPFYAAGLLLMLLFFPLALETPLDPNNP